MFKRIIKAIFGLLIFSFVVTAIPFGKIIVVIIFAVLLIKEAGIVKITINPPSKG